MIPGPLTAGPLLVPAARPVPLLTATVRPRAARSGHHVSGAVIGARVLYADLAAFAWFTAAAAGRDLRGARQMFTRVGLRGVEDVNQRKQ